MSFTVSRIGKDMEIGITGKYAPSIDGDQDQRSKPLTERPGSGDVSTPYVFNEMERRSIETLADRLSFANGGRT